jgi:hypothetical protein
MQNYTYINWNNSIQKNINFINYLNKLDDIHLCYKRIDRNNNIYRQNIKKLYIL